MSKNRRMIRAAAIACAAGVGVSATPLAFAADTTSMRSEGVVVFAAESKSFFRSIFDIFTKDKDGKTIEPVTEQGKQALAEVEKIVAALENFEKQLAQIPNLIEQLRSTLGELGIDTKTTDAQSAVIGEKSPLLKDTLTAVSHDTSKVKSVTIVADNTNKANTVVAGGDVDKADHGQVNVVITTDDGATISLKPYVNSEKRDALVKAIDSVIADYEHDGSAKKQWTDTQSDKSVAEVMAALDLVSAVSDNVGNTAPASDTTLQDFQLSSAVTGSQAKLKSDVAAAPDADKNRTDAAVLAAHKDTVALTVNYDEGKAVSATVRGGDTVLTTTGDEAAKVADNIAKDQATLVTGAGDNADKADDTATAMPDMVQAMATAYAYEFEPVVQADNPIGFTGEGNNGAPATAAVEPTPVAGTTKPTANVIVYPGRVPDAHTQALIDQLRATTDAAEAQRFIEALSPEDAAAVIAALTAPGEKGQTPAPSATVVAPTSTQTQTSTTRTGIPMPGDNPTPTSTPTSAASSTATSTPTSTPTSASSTATSTPTSTSSAAATSTPTSSSSARPSSTALTTSTSAPTSANAEDKLRQALGEQIAALATATPQAVKSTAPSTTQHSAATSAPAAPAPQNQQAAHQATAQQANPENLAVTGSDSNKIVPIVAGLAAVAVIAGGFAVYRARKQQ